MESIYKVFLLSLLLWLLPFLVRITYVDTFTVDILSSTDELSSKTQSFMGKTLLELQNSVNYESFVFIFTNNLKGCLINIFGGIFLGLGTSINLLYNGFFSADMFVNSYKAGVSLESIMKVTLPHSFELIGFWLSGAIGFYVAWNIYRLMRGKDILPRFYRHVGLGSLAVFVIILAAAYVEAYISTSFVTQ